jgi:hypothetical protein
MLPFAQQSKKFRTGAGNIMLIIIIIIVVAIVLGYRLDDRGSRVRFPAGAGNFSLHHRV